MRIDGSSDHADEPDDAHTAHRARPTPDNLNAADKDPDKAVSEDGPPDRSPARPDPALQAQRTAAYHSRVEAVYEQYAIDHGNAPAEKPECETVSLAMRRIEDEDAGRDPVGLEDRQKDNGQLPEADAQGERVLEHHGWDGGDLPDDPRNYSNPKTGRFDASWSTYDHAIAAARKRTGGDLGPDSIKMYDYSPDSGDGTGTLIGEQSPDRLRGWRIDGQDGHVNWWDWTGGKKGAGGVYGHDWFPPDPSTPGSRYIGWAPWQDNDGIFLEGN